MSDYIIVCIDDEPDILEYTVSMLKEVNHKVVRFIDPSTAVKFIIENQKQIIMIFSDFEMPEMTGFDVRAELLINGIDLPFAIFTGYYNADMATEAMRLRICEFIQKPSKGHEFIDVLSKYGDERIANLAEEQEMIVEFLSETMPMLDEIEEIILSFEQAPADERSINTYFRLLHTIKGTASCLGLKELATFAHHYEDLINRVKSKEITINDQVTEAFLKGFDYLKHMYSCERKSQKFPYLVDDIIDIFEGDFISNSVNINDIKSDSKNKVKKIEVEELGKDEKVGISVDLLSDFLELSGEITVLKNTIFKSLIQINNKYPGDHDLEQLSDSMSEMHKVSSLLQNQISEMKKINMDAVFKPMKRVIRDSAKTCNKKINLKLDGGKLRVDTVLGKLLNNVLVHMLRNSVDHGIELPEERLAIGKPEEGVVSVNCYETGENIHVEIEDDGKGIDVEKIKAKILDSTDHTIEDLNKMSNNRIFQFLFESGLSTAEKVTSISGRGVGMDMVKSSIEEAGGKIYIDSEVGKGTKFVLIIPIPRSVLIIKSLMIQSDHKTFTIPLDHVAEVVLYEEAREGEILHQVEGENYLSHHNKLIPLVELREALDLPPRSDLDTFNIVIVKSEGYMYGIVVDAIQDIEEIVVKKLAPILNYDELFTGATFVGEGGMGLIIDLKGIARKVGIHATQNNNVYEDIAITHKGVEEEYMQFNLLDHDHYCLPLSDVNRLEVIDPKTVQYSGELPIVQYRGENMPLMLLESELELYEISFEEFLEDREQVDIIVVNHHGKNIGLLIHEINDIGKTHHCVDNNMKEQVSIAGTIFINEHIYTVIDLKNILKAFELTGFSRPELIEADVLTIAS
ncbi:MAG: response regulator [Bacteriovoracaceae bacterium]|jgi:two-component system, chemotaxis family, sensor kinase CheA|nr:response regulator [Bacteriovoracaceae bacterium]